MAGEVFRMNIIAKFELWRLRINGSAIMPPLRQAPKRYPLSTLRTSH